MQKMWWKILGYIICVPAHYLNLLQIGHCQEYLAHDFSQSNSWGHFCGRALIEGARVMQDVSLNYFGKMNCQEEKSACNL